MLLGSILYVLAIVFIFCILMFGLWLTSRKKPHNQTTQSFDNPLDAECSVRKSLIYNNIPPYIAPNDNSNKVDVFTLDDFKKAHPKYAQSSTTIYPAPKFDNL
jgi:hypothetical protein